MKVLVTGAAGFIGSHVCDALLKRGDHVTGFDDFNDFYDPAIKERNVETLLAHPACVVHRGHLLDDELRARVLREGNFDVVVHLAAWAGVRPSIARPAHYQRENVEATTALLDDIRRLDAPPRVVFASSSSVYGGNTKVPFHEDDPVINPVSPYAASKRAGELVAKTFHHLYGTDVSCLRFFTVYGPRQRPEMAIHAFSKMMLDGKPIPMFGDGSTSRDYTFIDDIVGGVLGAVDHSRGFQIYNLGNSDPIRLDVLIQKIGVALDVTPIVKQLPLVPGDVETTFANVDRARRDLGYMPTVSIDDGLARFARWLKRE